MSSYLIDLAIILVLVIGISQFRTPRRARLGNLWGAAALSGAVVVVLIRHPIESVGVVLVAFSAGGVSGAAVACRVQMIQVPSTVAFQHGMGGLAALLIATIELTRQAGLSLSPILESSALLGLVTGGATFSGSLIAAAKLANWLRQTPMRLPRHNVVLVALAALLLLLMTLVATSDGAAAFAIVGLVLGSMMLGGIVAVRVGGADMPVLISFLNATAGLAASLCGIAVGSRLLVACGATVAASGSILTHVMCQAMNRGLRSIFAGAPSSPANPLSVSEAICQGVAHGPPAAESDKSGSMSGDPFTRAMTALRNAQRVILIPGFGMALADAQEEVVKLGDTLSGLGKNVQYAIHPVAGRMPGHMHVLLAEAEVDYSLIRDLKDINREFAQTDLALIVGACDVVNPAALDKAGTPISGMPILRADEARDVIVCNLDERPGYSGVDNPLYRNPRTILLWGNAKYTINRLIEGLA
jgi:NAD(P) transhydrogenase subunit beta